MSYEVMSEKGQSPVKMWTQGVTVEDDTFAIPAGAPLKTDALQTFDVDASLRTLASGNLAELPGLLQPRLRVPG